MLTKLIRKRNSRDLWRRHHRRSKCPRRTGSRHTTRKQGNEWTTWMRNIHSKLSQNTTNKLFKQIYMIRWQTRYLALSAFSRLYAHLLFIMVHFGSDLCKASDFDLLTLKWCCDGIVNLLWSYVFSERYIRTFGYWDRLSVCLFVCNALEVWVNKGFFCRIFNHLLGQGSGSVWKQEAQLSQRGREMLRVCL